MSIKKTLGGDRLGAGKKMQVEMHGFQRSSHDLGRIWRSTMSAGTLVPFLVEYALPGDVFDIELDADVKTYPTLGPLFGSFKLQLDVFQAPLRLYNAQLHNNALGIGMNMNQIKLPKLNFKYTADNQQQIAEFKKPFTGKHINTSAIHAYLGIRGLGQSQSQDTEEVSREFNGIPYLAYWDIYKNYYANKQEEIGYVIHGEPQTIEGGFLKYTDERDSWKFGFGQSLDLTTYQEYDETKYIERLELHGNNLNANNIEWFNSVDNDWNNLGGLAEYNYVNIEYNTNKDIITITKGVEGEFYANESTNFRIVGTKVNQDDINLYSFDLKNIDDMRDKILSKDKASAFIIDQFRKAPYGLSLKKIEVNHKKKGNLKTIASYFSQEGLGIKTYQSDVFNNWLSTEWIDGAGGISEITAIDTSDGSFKIDTLNLANKVYDMLNRIAVSGGSYDDWIEANWAHEAYRRCESPIYHGGLSKEVVFQEVVSTAFGEEQNTQALGTLAGKGTLSRKHKGGSVTIKIHEPSVIIGIVSLTPRIDYSQGNEWHTALNTMDDFHKPSLDEIGFQELITEQMAEFDAFLNDDGTITRFSAGKQPAWINYMTSYNRTYGNFADEDKEMYMTLNRRYEYDDVTGRIKDLTTYIDPKKFNYLFAYTDLSAQNFWVQIGADITARRKMSAKIMPNL